MALRVGPVGPFREAGLGSSGGQDWARCSGFNRLVDRVRTSLAGGPSAERARFPSIIILRHEVEVSDPPTRFLTTKPLALVRRFARKGVPIRELWAGEGREGLLAAVADADDTDMYILLRLAP